MLSSPPLTMTLSLFLPPLVFFFLFLHSLLWIPSLSLEICSWEVGWATDLSPLSSSSFFSLFLSLQAQPSWRVQTERSSFSVAEEEPLEVHLKRESLKKSLHKRTDSFTPHCCCRNGSFHSGYSAQCARPIHLESPVVSLSDCFHPIILTSHFLNCLRFSVLYWHDFFLNIQTNHK